ncbi:phosphopantetheine-binding protein [Paenibacillus sp. y28]|uniref:phosphopantetheine-binding protein n=1 Tax=Paenibacillus sp. y28 TaxID=3129110 RepID=UPI00301B45D7
MATELEIAGIVAGVLKVEPEQVIAWGWDANLTDYQLSSVLVVELVVALEIEFNIAVDDDDLLTENVNSINKIKQLVEKYESGWTNEQTAG